MRVDMWVGDPLAGNYVRVKNLNVVLWDKGIYYDFEARLRHTQICVEERDLCRQCGG